MYTQCIVLNIWMKFPYFHFHLTRIRKTWLLKIIYREWSNWNWDVDVTCSCSRSHQNTFLGKNSSRPFILSTHMMALTQEQQRYQRTAKPAPRWSAWKCGLYIFCTRGCAQVFSRSAPGELLWRGCQWWSGMWAVHERGPELSSNLLLHHWQCSLWECSCGNICTPSMYRLLTDVLGTHKQNQDCAP